MQFLVKDLVAERKEGQTLQELSPVQSSESNGQAERGIQEVEAIIPAMLLALEENLRTRVDARERIVAFIPEFAAYLFNRIKKGEDGKFVYERIKGKKPTRYGLESGEKLWFKKKDGQKMEKLNARWLEGIFIQDV